MKMLLYKNELNSFIESYESSVLKPFIKYSIQPFARNGEDGRIEDSYWVKFDECMFDDPNLLNIVFRAGVIHGKSLK